MLLVMELACNVMSDPVNYSLNPDTAHLSSTYRVTSQVSDSLLCMIKAQ